MANNDPPVKITSKGIVDYAKSLEHAAKLLRETSEAMEKNQIADLMVLNFKTGDRGHQGIVKFASYVHIAFGERLANRTMAEIRESKKEYETSKKADSIVEKAAKTAKTSKKTN
jgi:hypothetical protein